MKKLILTTTFSLIIAILSIGCGSSESDFQISTSDSPADSESNNYEDSSNGIDISEDGKLTLSLTEGWWNSDWKYRKTVTIHNANDDIQNYQLKLSVEYDESMNLDFSDIRFINDAGNPLNFWVENITDGSSATAWVNVDSLNNGTNDIFIYYGNPTASEVSNGENTFLFFDDFETFEGWMTHGGGSLEQSDVFSFSGNNSVRKITNNDPNGGYKDFTDDLSRGVILEFYVYRFTGYSGGAADRVGLVNDDGDGYGWIYNHSNQGLGIDRRSSYSGAVSAYVEADNTLDGWVFGKLIVTESDEIIAEHYVDGVVSGETSYSNTSYDNFSRVYIFGGHDYLVDQIKVRKYVTEEPIHSFSSKDQRYSTVGIATSKVFYTESASGVEWKNAFYEASEAGVAVKIRTADDVKMNGAPDFSNCEEVISGMDISNNNCVTDGQRFYQYQVTLSSDDADTPFFQNISIDFDKIAPDFHDSITIVKANAGPDRISAAGKSLVLDGTASEGENIIYNWAIVSGDGKIHNPTSSTPDFTSSTTDKNQGVAINLTVRAPSGERSTDEVIVHVFAEPYGSEIDSTTMGGTDDGDIIYGNNLDADGENIFESTIGNTAIQIPCDNSDLYLDVTKSNQPVIGVPHFNEYRGIAYFFGDPLDNLPDVVNVTDTSVFDITLSDTILLSEAIDSSDQNSSPTLLAINGNRPDDNFGKYITSGDLKNDGVGETLIGAPGISTYGGAYLFQSTTEVTGILHGSAEYPLRSVILADILDGSGDDIIIGPDNPYLHDNILKKESYDAAPASSIVIINGRNNFAGVTILDSTLISVSVGSDENINTMTTGDINGDGHSDLIISSNNQTISVYYGPLPNGVDLNLSDANYDIRGGNPEYMFGHSLAVDDVNGDGTNDIVIGAPAYSDHSGAIYIVLGSVDDDDWTDINTEANVLFASGKNTHDRLGNDILLLDTDNDGASEIFSTLSDNRVYKLNLSSLETEENEDSTEEASSQSSGGCNFTQTKFNPTLFTLLLSIILAVGFTYIPRYRSKIKSFLISS